MIAVELHPGRARRLRDRFAGVTVVNVDIADFRWPRRPFRVGEPAVRVDSAVLVLRRRL